MSTSVTLANALGSKGGYGGQVGDHCHNLDTRCYLPRPMCSHRIAEKQPDFESKINKIPQWAEYFL